MHSPCPVQTMLGAWDKNSGAGTDMGSQLAQTVAANKLANSYMAFNTNYHDTGGWGGVAGWILTGKGPWLGGSLMTAGAGGSALRASECRWMDPARMHLAAFLLS